MSVFEWRQCGFTREEVLSRVKKLSRSVAGLRRVVKEREYSVPESSLVLPFDSVMAHRSKLLASRLRGFDVFVVVGIGGSNLGTLAVQEVVVGKNFNLGRKKVFFLDTVDPVYTGEVVEFIRKSVAGGKKVVVNVVSKSGTTTESLANLECLLPVIERQRGFEKNVVVTTDKGSQFERLAREYKFHTLPIPPMVGGRYSVFSPVGVFPLALMGVDVDSLLAGGRYGIVKALYSNESTSGLMAAILELHYRKGAAVFNNFYFYPELEAMGKWYRQLFAESLGKTKNALLPTVSIGSTDLHSVAQHYLTGPNNIFHRFVTIANQPKVKVPKSRYFAKLSPVSSGKELGSIMRAISTGTKTAFAKAKRPFVSLELPDTSVVSIGEAMQMQMIEVMLLADLLKVNAFDQPAVELYKKETRKLLEG